MLHFVTLALYRGKCGTPSVRGFPATKQPMGSCSRQTSRDGRPQLPHQQRTVDLGGSNTDGGQLSQVAAGWKQPSAVGIWSGGHSWRRGMMGLEVDAAKELPCREKSVWMCVCVSMRMGCRFLQSIFNLRRLFTHPASIWIVKSPTGDIFRLKRMCLVHRMQAAIRKGNNKKGDISTTFKGSVKGCERI